MERFGLDDERVAQQRKDIGTHPVKGTEYGVRKKTAVTIAMGS